MIFLFLALSTFAAAETPAQDVCSIIAQIEQLQKERIEIENAMARLDTAPKPDAIEEDVWAMTLATQHALLASQKDDVKKRTETATNELATKQQESGASMTGCPTSQRAPRIAVELYPLPDVDDP